MRFCCGIHRSKGIGWWVIIYLGFCVGHPVQASVEPVTQLTPGAYLVVGVFAYPSNAARYLDHLREQGRAAFVGYYPPTSYYYVYTQRATELRQLYMALRELRQQPPFSEAWLLFANNTQEKSPTASNTFEGKTNSDHTTGDNLPSQYIRFKTFNESGNSLAGQIKLISIRNSEERLITATDSLNELTDALRAEGHFQVVPQVLGYRSIPLELSFKHSALSGDTTLLRQQQDTLTIQLPLVALQPGDTQVLFHTFFYPNSAVMRPRSKPQMEALVQLLQQQPRQRIRLHGHTNGSGRGFMYTYAQESKNFFTLHQNREHRKKGVGAKRLSALRAYTIKEYLEYRGIAAGRIETKGWGGRKPLYDPDSPMGSNNIRVEVELLPSIASPTP